MRIAIIPARGGSRRIPRKNIREFRGKPMMQWPIEAAQKSGLFDAVVVSTDDEEIAWIADRLGCVNHWRDKDDGTKGTQEVARDVLQSWPEVTEAAVIYPCSPLLQGADIRAASLLLETTDADYVVTSYPDRIEDCGCLYFGLAEAFRQGRSLVNGNTRLLPLPATRCIDINTVADWLLAESMFDALRRANE